MGKITIHLVLTYHWCDETEQGRKDIEYREMTPHWEKLIWERRKRIPTVRFVRGYTSTMMVCPVIKIDVGRCPYPGWDGDYYRIHFEQVGRV